MKIGHFGHKASMIFQFILGIVFIFSGLKKIANPDAFLIIVHNYRLLPNEVANILAKTLPWIEFIFGSLMLLGIYVKQSAFAISLLLFIFIFAISINVLRGIDFSCGCFSLDMAKSSRTNAVWWIFRDIILLMFGTLIFFSQKNGIKISKIFRRKHA
jgi:uncharacterized membrane protein YphA (DoxX/SURF4 family)